jgi:V8-like Glu-specific endopeptidase
MKFSNIILIGVMAVLIGGAGVFVVKNNNDVIKDLPVNGITASSIESIKAVELEVSTTTKDEILEVVVEDSISPEVSLSEPDDNNVSNELEAESQVEESAPSEEEVAEEENTADLVNGEVDYNKYSNFIEIDDLEEVDEKDIDIKAIVLVRCIYKSQLFAISSAKEDEMTFTLGTGFFVNPNGTIVTAGHVVREESSWTDSSDRTWSFDKCQISRTKSYNDKIRSTDMRFLGGEPWFEDVDIIYEPSDDLYKDGKGLDVAVLQLKEGSDDNSFFELVPQMVKLEQGYYGSVAVGYPGMDIIMQIIERADGAFAEIGNFEESTCEGQDYETPCGWRYILTRDLEDLNWNLGYYTYLGKESTNVRGGFSGAPVLINGNVIGILTHSRAKDENSGLSGVDIFHVLTSYDVVETLKSEGVSI